jgi:undecaprenyl diphosphate synthase
VKLRFLLNNLRGRKGKREDFLLADTTAPDYVAIIPDGNGRWAAERHLPAIAGHRQGAKTLKRIVRASQQMGVKELTVYTFSTENWGRPSNEVNSLMDMFSELIDEEVPELHQERIRISFLGRREKLSDTLRDKIVEAERLTAENDVMTFYIAFNYGGRAEIVDAARTAAGKGEIDETGIREHLYAPEMHDPELLIRTSGEQRLSNFLLWQCAYSELYFSDKLWPAFSADDLSEAFADFRRRQRRFGTR